jgi:predicted NBD/HSP70 family sugar kinase
MNFEPTRVKSTSGSSPAVSQGSARAASDHHAFIGIRLGPYDSTVAVADARRCILSQKTSRASARSTGLALPTVTEVARVAVEAARLAGRQVRGVGVAVPGLVNRKARTLISACGTGWREIAIGKALTDALQAPVSVRSDVQAAAIAQCRQAERPPSFARVHVDAGIRSAIVIDGALLYGHQGLAGNLAHLVIEADGPACACGLRGCLDAVASDRAIEAAAKSCRAFVQETDGAGVFDATSVVAAAERSYPNAMRIVDRAGRFLGVALSHLINLLALDTVVLDGPAFRAGEYLLRAVREAVAKDALRPESVRITRWDAAADIVLEGTLLLAANGDL